MRLSVLLAAVLFALPGCREASEPTEPLDAAPQSEEPLRAAGTIRGQTHYLERIAMPDDAYLVLRILDAGLSDAGRALVAEHTLEDVGNPPYRFEFEYDPERIQAGRDYVLAATLYDPDGRSRFTTPVPVELDPYSDSWIEFRLSMVAEPPDRDQVVTQARGRAYQCGDLRLEARFEAGDALVLILPWADLALAPAPSEAGARFSDGRSEFHTVDEASARLVLDGGEPVECRVTERRSPWAEAQARGVGFRAAGQEPGWVVEVDGGNGDPPMIWLELDYGTHHLEFNQVRALDDQAGYVGEAAGNRVLLQLDREPCTDPMSGQVFPVRVQLVLNDRALNGCGRFLEPAAGTG